MFIYNVKLNSNVLLKTIFVIISVIVIIFFGISAYRIFNETVRVKDTIPASDVCVITANNYTNILKTVHENLDNYVGQKITCSGYVYRVSDFNSEQFVIARDMILNSDTQTMQTVVVGFLCNSKEAKNFENNTWVEITGEITKGDYHGTIPVIKITKISNTSKPADTYVYPPDDTYIPTAILFSK